MSDLFHRIARALTAPLLGWMSSRFDGLRERLDQLLAGQADAAEASRRAATQRDDGLEVVSRAVGVQGAALESLRAEQAQLVEEVRLLREQLLAMEAQRDRVEP